MQLKLQRTQKTSGMMSKTVVFCLDARAELTPDEQESVNKYKLGPMAIYNSESSKRHMDSVGEGLSSRSLGGTGKALVGLAMAKLSLNISIDSLVRGQHIECKDLEELLGAEEAVLAGCKMLKLYLDTAKTFDGSEVVIDFNEPEQQVAAA